jgi:UDP-glucose 4-epimerase
MKLLITGGLGYIGSHTVVALLDAGHEVVVIDNLCNSVRSVRGRIASITGKSFTLVEADVADRAALDAIFLSHHIDAVIHFAGLKAVGESVAQPLRYYHTNLGTSMILLAAMSDHGVRRLVFSSSATVYGAPNTLPIRETAPLAATHPYGRSKLMIEDMLRDLAASEPGWQFTVLRYFNPVGAHESGLIGEAPNGIPNNLMPYIAQVAAGRREKLAVFGNDYPTPDGTGMRDYLHVVDLALGHLCALERMDGDAVVRAYNLGTGQAHSVLQMVQAFERASGRPVACEITARRPGDVASCYADASLALAELGWKAERGIDQMCRDTWRWQCHAERMAQDAAPVPASRARELARALP